MSGHRRQRQSYRQEHIQTGTVLDSATPPSSRAPRLMMSGRQEFSQKKGSLQRLPERSGEEIRTLDTAGMNRML